MISFLDLHRAVGALPKGTVLERAEEFARRHEGVHVVAVGGFPITLDETAERLRYRWCGGSTDDIAGEVRKALGLSAVLTYMNRNQLTTDELGDLCLTKDHDWALRWTTLSLLFARFPTEVEWAFARDTRFLMSWPVVQKGSSHPPVFVATSNLHSWVKFASHYEDPDFDFSTRLAMEQVMSALTHLIPEGKQKP